MSKFKLGDVVVLVRYPSIEFVVTSVWTFGPDDISYGVSWKGEETLEVEFELEHANIASSPLWKAMQ